MKMNWTKLVHEIPEKQQLKKFREYESKWKEGVSRDGYVITWVKDFVHKGIVFQLKILRYFTLDAGFTPMSFRSIDRHVVVEYPKHTEPLAQLVRELDIISEFLYHDTLHSYADKMMIEQQLQDMYETAISDIDTLPSKIKMRTRKLRELSKELTSLLRKYGRE